MRLWILQLLLLAALCPRTVAAQDLVPVYSGGTGDNAIPKKDEGFSLGFEADFASQYVWRGIALSQGPVLQPSLWLTLGGATFSAWGNFVLNDEPNQGQLNEVDFTLGYGRHVRRFFFNALLYFYLFPHQAVPATAEGSLVLGLTFGPVKVYTNQNSDFIANPGGYFGFFGLSYEKRIHPVLSMKTSAEFGWANGSFNRSNFGISKFAANLFDWELEFQWLVKSPFYLRPYLEVDVLLDSDLRRSVADPNIVSGGLGFQF
jgi:hypothetical protein